MVGAVMLDKIAPDKATASSILSNAHALIRERLTLGGSARSVRIAVCSMFQNLFMNYLPCAGGGHFVTCFGIRVVLPLVAK
jgi:hypothetical protein